MKNIILIILVTSLFMFSCKEDENYREKFVGTYDIEILKKQSSNSSVLLRDSMLGTLQVSIDEVTENKIKLFFSSNIDFTKIDGHSLAYTHDDFRNNIVTPNVSKEGNIDYQPEMDCAVTHECMFGYIFEDSINLSYWYSPNNLSINYKIKGIKK